MCVLCGALGGDRHWAEKGRDTPARWRERRVRIRLLNRVLGHSGGAARIRGRGYMLEAAGREPVRVENLGALWAEVERATGRRCDPLDPALLAGLRRSVEP
jgi:hypothetical protein